MANRQFSAVDGVVYDTEPGKTSNNPNPGFDRLVTPWFGSVGANPPIEGTTGLVRLPMLDTGTLALSTGALTTTVSTFFPAGFRLLAGAFFVNVAISGGGVTTLTLGDGTVANRFGTISTLTINATSAINSATAWDNPANAANAGPFLANATNLVITANAQNTVGSIHIVFWGIQVGTLVS